MSLQPSFQPPQPPPPPPPSPPSEMMLRATTSPGARIAMLVSCLVIIVALQYPLVMSYFQKDAVVVGAVGERGKVLAAVAGYEEYGRRMSDGLKKKRTAYNKLKSRQKLLLASTVKYIPKISHASAAASTNHRLAHAVAEHAMCHYNITPFELHAYRRTHRAAGDHTQVVQALRHFVRDWADAGDHERAATHPLIAATMCRLFPVTGGTRVLVPGAGLGRLAYQLADRGFDVVANEYSSYMLLALRYMLYGVGGREVGAHMFHANVNWWSHQRTTAEGLLRGVEFPDVVVEEEVVRRRLQLVEGDFVTALEGELFDAVVTLFFIDTAKNIVDYLETIYGVLKPGGVWVNLGPLLYGTAPLVELSLDEVLRVAEKIGFELMPVDADAEQWGQDMFPEVAEWRGRVRGGLAGYSWDQDSLSRNAYLAQFWVARKKVRDEEEGGKKKEEDEEDGS